MDKFDRMQQLHRIFSARKTPIRISTLAEKLECSEKTIYRAIQNLRDYVQAPLVDSLDRDGWYYDLYSAEKFELPGLWLTAEEINGLAIIMELTREFESSLLTDDIALVTGAVEKLLKTRKVTPAKFRDKVAYLPKRKFKAKNLPLQKVSAALLQGNRIGIRYIDYQGEKTDRTISPIKLVLYDENWYIDAWCHLRKALRSFLVARIEKVEELKEKSKDIPEEDRKAHFASSYGIFAGSAKHIARLKFIGTAAREAASYSWHIEQKTEWQDDALYLDIPYSDERELIRSLLVYGAQVEILAPDSLKSRLLNIAKSIVTNYEPDWGGGRF